MSPPNESENSQKTIKKPKAFSDLEWVEKPPHPASQDDPPSHATKVAQPQKCVAERDNLTRKATKKI